MATALKPLPEASPTLLFTPERDTAYAFFADGVHHKFETHADRYQPVNGWWLAEAALLAYFDAQTARARFSAAGLSQFHSAQSVTPFVATQCYVAGNNEFVIVTFRGTRPNVTDLITDLRCPLVPAGFFSGRVHEGFRHGLESVWEQVTQILGELTRRSDRSSPPTVWFAGHSLGGALATLAAARWGPSTSGVYSIGSPRIGDAEFCGAFSAQFGNRCFRYVNNNDIVTRLPLEMWGYRDIETVRYMDAKGQLAVQPSTGTLLQTVGIDLLTASLLERFCKTGRVTLPTFLSDHIPSRYSVHAWNLYAAEVSRAGPPGP